MSWSDPLIMIEVLSGAGSACAEGAGVDMTLAGANVTALLVSGAEVIAGMVVPVP
jgi:hypothetical protein